MRGLADYLRNMSVRKVADNALGWLPEYKTLVDAQDEMKKVNKDGYDNYAHRLAMCRIGQMGGEGSILSPDIGLILGLLKEVDDVRLKSIKGDMPWAESLSDSWKDIKNNYQALNYGLTHPDENCRIWLNNLDYKNNKWIK